MVFVGAYSSDVLNCFLLLKAGAEKVVNISTNCLLGSPTKQKYLEQYKRKRLDKGNTSARYHFLSIRLICRVCHYFYLFNTNSSVVCQIGMTFARLLHYYSPLVSKFFIVKSLIDSNGHFSNQSRQ